ncbi:CidA/LrgA family protein [Pokkaliibacter sp. CJK22405]|uniref:CidA/LrgA family protein n=1 Tax=Pokkaliibacter sp. CJK22405 TaxID=3384615 RepID=UPI0039852A40
MIQGFMILLFCQLLGEFIVRGFEWPFPGPVMGMVILLVGLVVYGEVPEGLRPVSDGLLKYLSLLFVPAGVGLMTHYDLISQDLLAIALAIVVSSIVSMVVCTWLMKHLLGRSQHEEFQE